MTSSTVQTQEQIRNVEKATCTCGRELVAGEGGVFVCVICGFDPADCRCFARIGTPAGLRS